MGAGGDEGGYVFERVDASTGSYGGAVEGGGGAGEFQLTGQGPVLEEGVDEACVEDVAGAGGVDDRNAEGRDVDEVFAVEGEDAFCAESGGREACVVAAVHLAEGLLEVGLGCDARGNVAADDEVVDVGEERFDVGVELVEVGDDGDAGFTGPGGGLDGGFGVVAVDVEGAGRW